jgi:hypothetical protein
MAPKGHTATLLTLRALIADTRETVVVRLPLAYITPPWQSPLASHLLFALRRHLLLCYTSVKANRIAQVREAAVAALAALTDAAAAADASAALVSAALDPAVPHAVRRAAFAVLPASAAAAGPAPRASALEAALQQLRRPDMRGQVRAFPPPPARGRGRAKPSPPRSCAAAEAGEGGGAHYLRDGVARAAGAA